MLNNLYTIYLFLQTSHSQTTMKLADIDFPVYLSLIVEAFDINALSQYGYDGMYQFFSGSPKASCMHGLCTHFTWNGDTDLNLSGIKSKVRYHTYITLFQTF